MSQQQNLPNEECKCQSNKKVIELQKKLRELNKFVNEKIPALEKEIATLRRAIKK